MFLLVLQFGCPLVTYGTPPEAECGQRDMGQLLVELSESFSEGFSADDARRAGARISQLPNKKGHVFRYGPVTFRGERYDDLSFYIHKRSGDHLWLSLYCHESPSLRPLVEEEIRILAGRLCR